VKVRTYDILNAGKKNRFMANGRIVSNSSGTVQWHNMVRDAFAKDYETIAEKNGLHPKNDKAAVKRLATMMLATAIKAGRTGDPDLLRMMYEAPRKDLQGRVRIEGVLPWVSRMSRRVVSAAEGHLLLNGDFSNIQARIPVWLAGQQETVDAFARGEDVYRQQASPVYGIPPEQLSSEQRQIGKVMRLFLSFLAGVNAFIPAAMTYGISIPAAKAKEYVDLFRATNKPLVDFGDANLQAAMWAVQYPGREFQVPPTGYVSWFMPPDQNCLCMRLPSGRLMRYWAPRLSQGYWQDGTPKRTLDLSVLAVKGPFTFRRNLWRGLALQNVTCAIEADLLCRALENMDREGLPVRLHVHDSTAAQVAEDKAEGLLPRFKDCMLEHDDWTKGLPIAADVDTSARFG
jgi:DNA polymerase